MDCTASSCFLLPSIRCALITFFLPGVRRRVFFFIFPPLGVTLYCLSSMQDCTCFLSSASLSSVSVYSASDGPDTLCSCGPDTMFSSCFLIVMLFWSMLSSDARSSTRSFSNRLPITFCPRPLAPIPQYLLPTGC